MHTDAFSYLLNNKMTRFMYVAISIFFTNLECNGKIILHYHIAMYTLQVKCEKCNRWYHCVCINQKVENSLCMLHDIVQVKFEGPCCSANGSYLVHTYNS